MLENAGIKVALLAHGSEIRHPQRHAERNRSCTSLMHPTQKQSAGSWK